MLMLLFMYLAVTVDFLLLVQRRKLVETLMCYYIPLLVERNEK